jgi:hypothetical protein
MKVFVGAAALLALSSGLMGCGGGIGAGDYVVYRIASSEGSVSEGCGIDVDDDDSTTLRSGASMLLFAVAGEEGETYYLDLDGGVVLEGGVQDDGSYAFSGESVDVEEFGGETLFDSDGDGLDDDGEDNFVDADGDNLEDSSFEDEMVDTDGDGQDDRFEDDLVDANGDGDDDRFVEIGGAKVATTQAYSVTFIEDGGGISGTSVVKVSAKCNGSSAECVDFPDTPECSITTEFVGVALEDAEVVIPSD